MSKTLVVVESPSKAKTINKYLGKDYLVRASYGHIADLANTGPYKTGINISKDFNQTYHILKEKKDKLEVIINAAKSVDEIILASDPDREGEAIAAHLAEYLQSVNKPIKRALFKEITKTGIKKGLSESREIDYNLVNAQKARRGIDRIVGYITSPIIINNFGNNLSAGRVQSVCTKLIVDREREISNFVPEEYWTLKCNVLFNNKHFDLKIDEKLTQKQAEDLKSKIENMDLLISSIEEKERKKNPPSPLITSSLAALASSEFKFQTFRTMKAAQSLYEAGLISYMRTDSYRMSDDSLTNIRDYLKTSNFQIPLKPNKYDSSGQDAHEAIRVTNAFTTPEKSLLNNDELKIYKLIWGRTVASQLMPAIYDITNIIIKIDDFDLKTSGRILKFAGWTSIIPDDDQNINLPKLKIGDKLELKSVIIEQKFTQPPSRFSEKTLIKELEKRGIGRPSTYASIMSKITDRNYVTEKNGMFYATELGDKVISYLDKYFDFVKYDFTASIENKLDEIAKGKYSYIEMMTEFYLPFALQVKRSNSDNIDYNISCKECNEKMLLRHGKFGFYMSCLNFPNCRYTYSVEMKDGQPVPKDNKKIVENVFCPKCSGPMVYRDGMFGPFYACVAYRCYGNRKIPFGKKCPDCSNELYATIFKGKSVLFCMGYPSCTYSEELEIELPDPNKIKVKK